MLQHLNELKEDCSDYGFEAVHNYHAIVLSEMEHNRLTCQDTEDPKAKMSVCPKGRTQQRLRVLQARP